MEKASGQKAKDSFRGIESLCRGSSRCFFTGNWAHFDYAVPSVWGALKQIHITLKKMTSFKEQDSEKVAEFLDILDNLNDLPVVYI